MMNINRPAKQLADDHVEQIEELAAAARERQIKRRVAFTDASRQVIQRLDQLLQDTDRLGLRAGGTIEYRDGHSRFQKIEHPGADNVKAIDRRGRGAAESHAAHPICSSPRTQ